MLNFFRYLLPALALLLIFPAQGHTTEPIQICIDAQNLQYSPTPNLPVAILHHTQCLENVALSPESKSIVYNNRGIARNDTGDFDGAIADFNQAIILTPNDPDTYVNRGVALRDKGDFDGAIADYNAALGLYPTEANQATIYFNRGHVRSDKGNLDGAILDYSIAIDITPSDAEIYASRAAAYKTKGDIAKAKADAKKARELDPRVNVPTFE